MPDDHLAAQLGKLEAILGKKVTLDPSARSDTTMSSDSVDNHVPSWEEEHLGSKTGHTFEDSVSYEVKKTESLAGALTASSSYKDIDPATLRSGEPVDEEISFCPWDAVVHYPARFIGKINKPRAQPFFDKLLEGKTWDFLYLHDPTEPEQKPCLLVPTIQFVRFLEGINKALSTELVIPKGPNKRLFNLFFGVGGTPRPRYLKRCRDQKKLVVDEWPSANDDDVRAFKDAADVHRDLWLSEWEKTKQHSYPDKKGSSDRAERKRAARLQTLSQTQLYLGLQGARDPAGKPVVFICIDIEALEEGSKDVSEIGIAVLDTRHLEDVEPGTGAENWFRFIDAHHLRVKEYAGLVNYRFVQGCPDNFNFGTSISPRRGELVDTLTRLLSNYDTRDVVLVGHNIQSDIQYLSDIGYQTHQIPGLIGDIDTQAIYCAWKDKTQSRGLWYILSDLDIKYTHLHNGGNDAVYTLQAMLGIAVKALDTSQDSESPAVSTPQ